MNSFFYTRCLLTDCCFKWEVRFRKHKNEQLGSWCDLTQCDVDSPGQRHSSASTWSELIAQYNKDGEWWDEEVITKEQYDQFNLKIKMEQHLNE